MSNDLSLSDAADEEQLPPHSEQSERAVLGCVFEEPTLLPDCIVRLRDADKCFYDQRHKHIYNTMLELFDDGVAVDEVTVTERMMAWGTIGEAGGVEYISTLRRDVTSTQNLTHYLDAVMGKYAARKVLALCTETARAAYAVNGSSAEFLNQFEESALGIRGSLESASSLVSIAREQQRLIADYESAQQHNTPAGIQTGFIDLDHLCGGMLEQEMIVLAGMQSTGKTTLALNIACNACHAGHSVGFISLETSGKKLVHRCACYLGQVEGNQLLRGNLTGDNMARINTGFSQLLGYGERLMISDAGGLDVKALSAVARRMHQRGARLFIIDYLQLIEAPYSKGEFERVTKVSRGIKALAKSLRSPVIILSAFNRESVRGKKPRSPVLSDLRMSGQIEYDADKAWMLYDPTFRQEFNSAEESRLVRCKVAKQKDGPLGDVDLTFFPKQFRMTSSSQANPDPHNPEQPAELPYHDA